MTLITKISNLENDTLRIASELATECFKNSNNLITLKGGLGAGKTTFCRGFISQWMILSGEKIPDNIISPSYNIAQIYGTKHCIAHLDLYRIKTIDELFELGFEIYIENFPVCLIEWVDHIEGINKLLPANKIEVSISFGSSGNPRNVEILYCNI